MAQTLLLYGESGLAKTTSVGLFARYQYEKTGQPVRLITCDSGFGPCQTEVDAGIIIPLRLESCAEPIGVLNKLSKGFWPTTAIDANNGLWITDTVSDFAPLFRMPNVRYPAGHRPPIADTVCGGYAIEGITRICELAAKSLIDGQQATGEPLVGIFDQMGEKFAFESRGTYKGVQRLISNAVTNFRGLPVDRVLWTGHEGKGKDFSGRQVLGPATFGPALTDKVGGWFEITLHHDSYRYQEKSRKTGKMLNKTAIRAWFQRHPDVEMTKFFWPAKLGLNPTLTAAMYELFEEGYFPLIMNMVTGEYQQGIHTFLHIIDHNGMLPGEGELVEQPVEFVEETMVQDELVLPDETAGEVAATHEGIPPSSEVADMLAQVAMAAEMLPNREVTAVAEQETNKRGRRK